MLDPYLQIAEATDFIDHIHGILNAKALKVDVVVELNSKEDIERFLTYAKTSQGIEFNQSHLSAKSKFFSAQVLRSAINNLNLQPFVSRIEFGQTLIANRQGSPSKISHPESLTPSQVAQPAKSKVLAGIIDHGCPFAHTEFMQGTTTRVVTLWDQDSTPEFQALSGNIPLGFNYGKELGWASLQAALEASKSPDGSTNETECYRLASYEALDGDITHGTHVLGRFVGRSYASALDLQGNEKTDIAGQADIAFIQLPRALVKCPSSSAAHRYILDGLRYLRDFASKSKYERCVVVCDYGSYLGPHDGSSLFERALDEFLSESNSVGIPFEIVFPSGNCHDEKLHARLSLEAGKSTSLDWNLPSFNEVATYAELWVPEHIGPQIENIRIVSKKGSIVFTDDFKNIDKVDNTLRWLTAHIQRQVDGQLVLTLRAAPTQAAEFPDDVSPSGKLTISITLKNASGSSDVIVHGYLCWGGEVIGFPRRMQQAWWSIPTEHGGRVEIAPEGTILGSACGQHSSIFVVGGYVGNTDPARRIRSTYSAVGPSRAKHRIGPNFVAQADESTAVKGIPGPGSRSAIVRNMWGTSVAAPLGARALLNNSLTPRIKKFTGAAISKNLATLGDGFLE
jgi:hypothetical protein